MLTALAETDASAVRRDADTVEVLTGWLPMRRLTCADVSRCKTYTTVAARTAPVQPLQLWQRLGWLLRAASLANGKHDTATCSHLPPQEGAMQCPPSGIREWQVTLLLADGFQRLLAHGIAQFHGLRSTSRQAWPGEAVISLTGVSSIYSPAPSPAAADSDTRVLVIRQLRSQEVGLKIPLMLICYRNQVHARINGHSCVDSV